MGRTSSSVLRVRKNRSTVEVVFAFSDLGEVEVGSADRFA
jgi:hypothetical protein